MYYVWEMELVQIISAPYWRSSPFGRPPYFRLAFVGNEPPYFGGSNPTQHTYLIKNTHKGCFLLNLGCAVCSFRAELFEIGRDIDYLKDKLGLVDLK